MTGPGARNDTQSSGVSQGGRDHGNRCAPPSAPQPVLASPVGCDIEARPAVARIRYTVYGGGYKYAYVCDKHWAHVRGRRGVDVFIGTEQGDHVHGWIGSDMAEVRTGSTQAPVPGPELMPHGEPSKPSIPLASRGSAAASLQAAVPANVSVEQRRPVT